MASEYLGITDALKGALGLSSAPTDVYNWSEYINTTPYDDWASVGSTIGDSTLDDIIGSLQQGSVGPLTVNNVTDVSGNYPISDIDTIQDMSRATPESGEANPSFGLDINDNYFTSGVPGKSGALPVNWEPTDIDDIIKLSTDNVGSDWSAGNPTTGYPNNSANNIYEVADQAQRFNGQAN